MSDHFDVRLLSLFPFFFFLVIVHLRVLSTVTVTTITIVFIITVIVTVIIGGVIKSFRIKESPASKQGRDHVFVSERFPQ